MLKYETLSPEVSKQIEQDQLARSSSKLGFNSKDIVRRNALTKDNATIWRPPFVHDIDKILHCQ